MGRAIVVDTDDENLKRSLKPGMRRVAIVCPTTDLCHTVFTYSLAQMMKRTLLEAPSNLDSFGLQFYGTSILPLSRQALATYALDVGATHTLWIDSDMEFPSDMLIRFLAHDAPIIGINASSRRPPLRNLAIDKSGDPIETTPESTGLVKAGRIGFGVAWIATDVFRKMESPWFNLEWLPGKNVFRGEDHFFSRKATEAGFELLIDQDISKVVNHMGTFGFNPMSNVVGEVGTGTCT